MRLTRTVFACTVATLLVGGQVWAQTGGNPAGQDYSGTNYDYSDYYADYYDEDGGADADAAPSAAEEADTGYTGGYDSCGSCGSCDSCSSCCEDPAPWSLISCGWLDDHGISIGGWLDQGFTWNPDSPADRFNGPVTFNDRANEYQMNQMWLYMGRETDTGGYGMDIGGRVDMVYGTDYRFTTARGLETHQDFSAKWNQSNRFYGLAMPQLYAEFAVNDLSVIVGHFFTIIGNEVVAAPDNFFYSHAYTMQYGEPFTHTGALARYSLGDTVTISAGVDRGWDNWEDNNDNVSFLGGVSWDSGEGTSLAFAMTSGNEGDNNNENRTMYSVVAAQAFGPVTYLFQHDLGVNNIEDGGDDQEWYGINQYLLMDVNDQWAVGGRFEWFRDDDGARVLSPFDGGTDGFAGNFFEMTAGINYRPHSNVIVRSECRWDWYDGVDPNGYQPYDNGTDSNQFLWGSDLILTY